MYHFDSDYMEGAHPAILERLTAINFDKHDGYGCDSICDSARARIREACGAPGAEVHLLAGGTQTNATMIKALLRPFEGAVAADTGHINIHEAGAVEATGHKVLPLSHTDGKLCAETVARYIDDFRADGNRDHMVWPGMVYISQPTEYGTLYTLDELEALSRVCRRRSIPLYMDGARLGYALAAPACDMTLRDVARLCDIFYIGGTKCGALLGEAVVIPRAGNDLGSHTINHHILTDIDPKYFAWELSSSKFFLKKEFDMYYVHLLSYPNGQYDDEVIAASQKYGYNYAVTGKNGAVDKNWVLNHPMEIGRVIVKGDMDEKAFADKLERSYLLGYLKSVVFGSLFFY